ncbi:MAG TPA: LCP family protein, partial [Jatrophihabitantaceae bacterium]|nr:LCP family protein [Jatrophihabitantaceae bacterium]
MSELPPLPPELDPRGKHRRHAAHSPAIGWHRVHTLVRVFAAALSVFLLAVFGVYWEKYHAFNAGIKRVDVFANNAVSKPKHDIDGKAQNILIVGNDDRQTATDAELAALGTGRDGGSLNTDTMMIVHVPANGAKATLISLPRDSYVNIPGYGYNKLNSAYAFAYNDASGSTEAKRGAGGAKLVQVVESLTGLTIDHYV